MSTLRQSGQPTTRQRAYDLAFQARMSVIYYEIRLTWLRRVDKGLRIGSLVLSSGGVYALARTDLDLPSLPIWLGALASVFTATTLVMGFTEDIRHATALLQQYIDHDHVFQELYLQGDDMDPDAFKAALKKLQETERFEAEKQPSPSMKLRERAQAQVLKEIGQVQA